MGKAEMRDSIVNVVKSDISTYVKIKMLQVQPEWNHLITRKLIMDALVFIDGFGSCLKEYMQPPIEKEAVQDFLKSEAFSYIYGRIEREVERG